MTGDRQLPSIMMSGTLGSGKTLAAERDAALRGSIVVDVDPQPDHRLEPHEQPWSA